MNEGDRPVLGDRGLLARLRAVRFNTALFSEIDKHAAFILGKWWPGVTLDRDITKLSVKHLRSVDLVCGGFPCQDISAAGKGAGLDGAHSGLWREMRRIIDEARPHWVLVENVSALRMRGADAVLDDLETLGYSCWPLVVRARCVGAPHGRPRVWIVGYSNSRRQSRLPESDIARHGLSEPDRASLPDAERVRRGKRRGVNRDEESERGRRDQSLPSGKRSDAEKNRGAIPDTEGPRLEVSRPSAGEASQPRFTDGCLPRWPAPPGPEQYAWEPDRLDGRTKYLNPHWVEVLMGFPMGWTTGIKRKHRLKCLGNAVVPWVVAVIGAAIAVVDQMLEE